MNVFKLLALGAHNDLTLHPIPTNKLMFLGQIYHSTPVTGTGSPTVWKAMWAVFAMGGLKNLSV
jgi:hypothetical protein